MFDVGIGELLIVCVIGLLAFGPERLPKAALDAARLLKQARRIAASARAELSDAAGVELSGSLQALGDLDPRALVSDFLEDVPISMLDLAGPIVEARDTANPPI